MLCHLSPLDGHIVVKTHPYAHPPPMKVVKWYLVCVWHWCGNNLEWLQSFSCYVYYVREHPYLVCVEFFLEKVNHFSLSKAAKNIFLPKSVRLYIILTCGGLCTGYIIGAVTLHFVCYHSRHLTGWYYLTTFGITVFVYCSPGTKICEYVPCAYVVTLPPWPSPANHKPQTKEPCSKMVDFDTMISHSFLGTKSLVWGRRIHHEHLLRPPNELVLHWRPAVADFFWGMLIACIVKLAYLASGIFLGLSMMRYCDPNWLNQ